MLATIFRTDIFEDANLAQAVRAQYKYLESVIPQMRLLPYYTVLIHSIVNTFYLPHFNRAFHLLRKHTLFVTDPLRILRALRFAARFTFELDLSLQEAASTSEVTHLPLESLYACHFKGIQSLAPTEAYCAFRRGIVEHSSAAQTNICTKKIQPGVPNSLSRLLTCLRSDLPSPKVM